MNILVVEDEPEMASMLIRGLREELLDAQLAQNGKRALQLSEEHSFDLILLDVMLPDQSGFDVVQQLRQRSQETPVLMLTARDALRDVVLGLDSGADDYLTKPFSFAELLARIRALGRRGGVVPKNVLEAHNLVLDVSSRRTFRRGQQVYLSSTEFRLLEVLVRNRGRVVTRKALLAAVWGNRRDVGANTLDAFVRLLRKKIEETSDVRLIHTHRGLGYSVRASAES
jgi:two-component system, OmpR family, copper resistance phosphate regulon response regulator CusR